MKLVQKVRKFAQIQIQEASFLTLKTDFLKCDASKGCKKNKQKKKLLFFATVDVTDSHEFMLENIVKMCVASCRPD